MNEYLAIVILLISVSLFYLALKKYKATKKLLKSGIKTNAKVIDLKKEYDGGTTNLPILEYTDWKNNIITFEQNSSSNRYSVGDIVKIVYSKDSNERRAVSFMGLYFTPILLSFIALFLFFVGLSGLFGEIQYS